MNVLIILEIGLTNQKFEVYPVTGGTFEKEEIQFHNSNDVLLPEY